MKRLILTLAIGLVALPVTVHVARAGEGSAPVVAPADAKPAADNSERNVRDREGTTLTPMDQGDSPADIAITQQIRKSVVARKGLSMDAQNVKIITRDGVVTLRGPVKNAQEKAAIAGVSTKTQGVTRVDNQLEIAAQP
jgi:osmotically-inducible protein OsmY